MKKTFLISGMSCASCASRIERALAGTGGVRRAVVNFPLEELTVEYDPDRIGVRELEACVRGLGYGFRSGDESLDVSRSQRNWFLLSLAASLPIMLAMPWHENPLAGWASMILATLVQFTAGLTFYRGSWFALKGGGANMDVMVALGTSAAYFYSLLAFFGILGSHGVVFFETSAMLITFIRLGKYLESRARGRAGEALKKLARLQADKARLVTGGVEKEVPCSTVREGDLVRNDLMDVVRAIKLGRATLAKIKQNLFWAFFYNVLGIPLAAGVFYYPFGVTLRPEFAGLAMRYPRYRLC